MTDRRSMTRRALGLLGLGLLAGVPLAWAGPADFETFVPPEPVPLAVPPLSTTPLPPARPVPSLMALQSARLFRDAVQHKCTNCGGRGEVYWQERVGSISSVSRIAGYRFWWYPVFERRSRPCPVCDHGFTSAKPEAQQNMARTQARMMAALEPQTPVNAKTQALAVEAFVQAMTWDDQLGGVIRDATAARLRSPQLRAGEAVAGSGPAAYDPAAGGRWVLRVDDRTVLVLVPRDAGAPRATDAVVYGGVVTDVQDVAGVRYVVAQGCLVRAKPDEGPPSWHEDDPAPVQNAAADGDGPATSPPPRGP